MRGKRRQRYFEAWDKGVAWVNGYNLGRYWVPMGPTTTLYSPPSLLNNAGSNSVLILVQSIRVFGLASSENVFPLPSLVGSALVSINVPTSSLM